jgi:hypothetical protein
MSDWRNEVSSLGEAYASMYNKDTEQLDEVIGGLNLAPSNVSKTIVDAIKGLGKGHGRGGQGNRGARRPTRPGESSIVAPRRDNVTSTPMGAGGTGKAPTKTPSSGSSSSGSSAPSRPAAPPRDRMANASKEDRMSAWAKANPKLAAAKAERDRTRGTTSSSNPMMRGLATRTAAPKAATPATKTSGATAIGKSAAPKPAASKPAAKPSGIKSARLSSALSNIPKFKAEHAEELIGYLIDEGFANNKENAEIILTHMSDEWLESLITE